MDKPIRMELGALTIACARPRMLANFYSALLGWPYVRVEEPGPSGPPEAPYALVCPPDGVHAPALNFEYDRHYRRPVWPSADGEQIATQHLDVGVKDLDEAVAWAVQCGATLADPQPASHFRVMLDPDGHPFCLCL